jgi:hypothetical protein
MRYNHAFTVGYTLAEQGIRCPRFFEKVNAAINTDPFLSTTVEVGSIEPYVRWFEIADKDMHLDTERYGEALLRVLDHLTSPDPAQDGRFSQYFRYLEQFKEAGFDVTEPTQRLQDRLGQMTDQIDEMDVEDAIHLYQRMQRDEEQGAVSPTPRNPKFMAALEAREWFEMALRCYEYQTLGEQDEEAERVFVKYPHVAYWYAQEILEGDPRSTPGSIKNAIATNPKTAAMYADSLKSEERHWKEGGTAEKSIATSAQWSVWYADTYGMRFELGEPAIMADPHWRQVYEKKMANGDIDPNLYIGRDGWD